MGPLTKKDLRPCRGVLSGEESEPVLPVALSLLLVAWLAVGLDGAHQIEHRHHPGPSVYALVPFGPLALVTLHDLDRQATRRSDLSGQRSDSHEPDIARLRNEGQPWAA